MDDRPQISRIEDCVLDLDMQPIIAQSLLEVARRWVAMHPAASLRDRELLAARVELELLGGMR